MTHMPQLSLAEDRLHFCYYSDTFIPVLKAGAPPLAEIACTWAQSRAS